MALPLLEYKPTAQNQRVRSFGPADENEDTPYIYRIEDVNSPGEIEALIKAAYRQVFSEHETLKFNRQTALESQLKNRAITVRDFIRGLAKSERFYNLVVEPNNNYRLVELCLKRLLGRAPYNRDEEIAWSIKTATLGWDGFVDALIDSEAYEQAFGESIVPYQRRRMEGRPFNLVTPRYDDHFRGRVGRPKSEWNTTLNQLTELYIQRSYLRAPEGDPRKYLSMASKVRPKPQYVQKPAVAGMDYLSKVPTRR